MKKYLVASSSKTNYPTSTQWLETDQSLKGKWEDIPIGWLSSNEIDIRIKNIPSLPSSSALKLKSMRPLVEPISDSFPLILVVSSPPACSVNVVSYPIDHFNSSHVEGLGRGLRVKFVLPLRSDERSILIKAVARLACCKNSIAPCSVIQ